MTKGKMTAPLSPEQGVAKDAYDEELLVMIRAAKTRELVNMNALALGYAGMSRTVFAGPTGTSTFTTGMETGRYPKSPSVQAEALDVFEGPDGLKVRVPRPVKVEIKKDEIAYSKDLATNEIVMHNKTTGKTLRVAEDKLAEIEKILFRSKSTEQINSFDEPSIRPPAAINTYSPP